MFYKPLTVITLLILMVLFAWVAIAYLQDEIAINRSDISGAEKIIGLVFNDNERDSLREDLLEYLEAYQEIRGIELKNNVPPAIQFNPLPLGFEIPVRENIFKMSRLTSCDLPENREDLAFYSIGELAELIHSKKITALELTQFFLNRLKKYDSKLHCVITLTEETALEEARLADQELAAGLYRGLLHGIPYGAKDLLAKKGYNTTWGAEPYKSQVIEQDASVIKKLREAGAVLIAKLSLGALAWGDVWYGEKTRNPWNLEHGSSGSSAGPAAAVSAGLVPFAIGSETWGSIVSPSTRCGTTGLRPTYGRVSRTGAMTLSWTMDKIGPICRTVEDCAIVFKYIYGPDDLDPTIIDATFQYNSDIDITDLQIGYLKSLFESEYENKDNDYKTLNVIKDFGIQLIPIELPETPISALSFILSAEAAAAFDDLTRSGRDDLMVRQIRNAWPNVFRAARFIPAVEYLQANRLRYLLIQEMQEIMERVDIYIAPSFGGNNLLLTNLTGHPCVVLPNGFNEKGSPTSISFIGKLFDEGKLLAFARTYQEATDYHKQHPPLFKD